MVPPKNWAQLSRKKIWNNRKASRKTLKTFTRCSVSRFTPFYLQLVGPTSTILDLTLKELNIKSWKPFLGTKSTWRYRWSPDRAYSSLFWCQLHLRFFFFFNCGCVIRRWLRSGITSPKANRAWLVWWRATNLPKLVWFRIIIPAKLSTFKIHSIFIERNKTWYSLISDFY